MPVVRRTLLSKTLPLGTVRTNLSKPSYALGSVAHRLSAQGLSPAQVDARHPRPAASRGAGYAAAPQRSATAHAAATAAAIDKATLLRTGHAPLQSHSVAPNPAAYAGRRAGGHAGGHGGTSGGGHH
ncbi:MAG TPA: hypothetical protein VG167_15030 [Verrucomicrobiae bacterium]|nr:hypothetical protein [Verrucomicrobiae bacterium]